MSLAILEQNLRSEVGEYQRFSESCWSPMHLLFSHLCADGPGQLEVGHRTVHERSGNEGQQAEVSPRPVNRCGEADIPPGDSGVDQQDGPAKRYYWQKYDVFDGEAGYQLQSVWSASACDEPQLYEAWMRELIGYAADSCGEEPWSEERIQQFLRSDDPELEVDGGLRIYRDFELREIKKAEYAVLRKYL